jgi:hypothetical protein
MGLPIQRPVQGLDKSNVVGFNDRARSTAGPRIVLQGWKKIASELDRSVRAVQRWERALNLPIHRLGKGKSCPVFAFRDELQLWLRTTAGEASENTAPCLSVATRKLASLDEQNLRNAAPAKGIRASETFASEPEIIKALNAFFALEGEQHKTQSCGNCHSPTRFLVGHFWLYGTDKTWQISVPFCPNCDSAIRALVPSVTGPQRLT